MKNGFHQNHFFGFGTSGCILFLIGFITLECFQRYYFLQDDNYAQFLPYVLYGCKSFFHSGIFPTFNPFQKAGAPMASLGIYALTYPVTYLSYFIANYVLQNDKFTFDVFAFIHLFAGYWVTYKLFIKLQVRSSLSMISALSWDFSGYFLIAGRCWYYMLPTVFWAPALLLLLYSLVTIEKNTFSLKWILLNAFSIALYFHSGNAQMWIYFLMFYFILIFCGILSRNLSKQHVVALVISLLIGLGLSLPLLLVQMVEFWGVPKKIWGDGIGRGLLSMFFSSPIVHSPSPNKWGNAYIKTAGELYYTNGLFLFAFLFCVIPMLKTLFSKTKKSSDLITRISFVSFGIAIFAFVLALGEQGYLWTWMSILPVFGKFDNPFKFLPFFSIFMLISSAILLEALLRKFTRYHFEKIILCVTVFMLGLHVFNCKFALYSYHTKDIDLDLAQSSPVFSQMQAMQNRILSLGPLRNDKAGYLYSLVHNFSSIFGSLSVSGYDDIVDDPDYSDLSYISAYGVRWVLLGHPDGLIDSALLHKYADNNAAKIVFENPSVTILEMKKYDAIAFLKGHADTTLPIHWRADGADIDIPPGYENTSAILSVFFRPFLQVSWADENKKISFIRDNWNRIEVPLSGRSKGGSLHLRYKAPWNDGICLGMIFILMGVLMFFQVSIRNITAIHPKSF